MRIMRDHVGLAPVRGDVEELAAAAR